VLRGAKGSESRCSARMHTFIHTRAWTHKQMHTHAHTRTRTRDSNMHTRSRHANTTRARRARKEMIKKRKTRHNILDAVRLHVKGAALVPLALRILRVDDVAHGEILPAPFGCASRTRVACACPVPRGNTSRSERAVVIAVIVLQHVRTFARVVPFHRRLVQTRL
jgi:hypothetical protein